MSTLFVVLSILAVILTLVGVVGSVVPALPGPPFSWAAMVIVYYICAPQVGLAAVVVFGILTLLAAILDYVAPVFVTKMGGGSRMAMLGSSVGVIVGLFFMPLGLILGPLAGAFLGEMMATNRANVAFRVAILSFIAFLVTSGIKLVLSLLMTYYVLDAIIRTSI